MKKSRLFFLFLIIAFRANANIGDTTFVQAQNAVHMNWWGQYNTWAAFPPSGISYGKILMDFKIGCPPSGCSAWDYTVQVEALHHTGQIDSTLNQAPSFTADGTTIDSLYFNTDTTYVTFYDTLSMSTDSTPASPIQIMIFGDTLNPTTATDSLWVFPGNYYNYLYTSAGVVYDSIYVPADSLWIVNFTPYYVSFEVVENIELGRVMTPYGGYYNTSWNNTWIFDVTDYALILHDSVEIRAFYGGWSDGFAITVDFRMIEGTLPRNVSRIRNIYFSGPGGFPYGNTGNPIENYLVPKTFDINSSETMAVMRVIPSGHGAGTSNCSEFCAKTYHVLVDGVQSFNQQVWRSDCGMNSLYHQAGTWIYDRANWCPGEKTVIKNHELTPLITPGDSVMLDMDFDPYTNSVGGQNPNYIIAAQLITYSSPNFITDASIDDIIAPNNFFNHNRFNPVCSHPVIVIKNTGSDTLISLDIHYGIEGGTFNSYTWTGSLNFLDTAIVTLGSINFGSVTGTPDAFKVYVDNPNGGTDQYAYNDTMRSKISFTPVYPSSFVVVLRTNNAPNESSWKLRDETGNIIYQSAFPLTANAVYQDTVNLVNGCYEFILYDSGKDGLSFFANNDGIGFCRFQQANGTTGIILTFQPDFGTQIGQRFTVGYPTAVEEEANVQPFFRVFPNPSTGKVTLDIALEKQSDMELSVINVTGQQLYKKSFENFKNDILSIDLSSQPSGIYFVRMKTNDHVFVKKIVIETGK